MKKIFNTKKETTIVENTTTTIGGADEKGMKDIAPKKVGMLDMVIAFDTTGSMAAYIDDVRRQVHDSSRITTTCVSASWLSATIAT